MATIKKLSKKALAEKVDLLFKKLGSNVQFNIMDLGKINDSAEQVLINGGTDDAAEEAMKAAITQYRLS